MDEKPSTNPSEPPVAAELRTLVQQAQSGDTSALPKIRRILDEHPETWQHIGNLASLVERAWISVLAADNPLAVESMRRAIANMKVELAGEHATRLEKMLVDQVVANWLEVQCAENLSADVGGATITQATFRLKRLESAQRRYREAINSLATIRQHLPKGLAPGNGIRAYNPEAKRA